MYFHRSAYWFANSMGQTGFFLLQIVKTNYETIKTAIITLTKLSYLSNQYEEFS